MQPTWLFLLTSTLLLSSHHASFTSTHAQTPPSTFTPTPLFFSQSVFIERQKFFNHGGAPSPSNQTFYIDLSKPWTTSSPIYGKLADGPAAMGSTTALNSNKSFWYSFYTGRVNRFNIQLNIWETVGPTVNLRGDGDPAFVDPATNQLYVLNGYTGLDNVRGTLRYNTTASSSSPWSNVSQMVYQVTMGISASWNTLKKTAFIFGGITLKEDGYHPSKLLYLYDPTSVGNITLASVTGNRPTARFHHCMVEAYNGTKMILFGGFGGYERNQAFDDIYILDVESTKWTRGTPGGPTVARGQASCAVTNDLLVVWGGTTINTMARATSVVSQNVTLVYNLKTNQWQDTYSPDPYVPPPPPPPTVTTPSISGTGTGSGSDPTGTGAAVDSGATSDSSSSIGWIIGGAVGGGLAVVGNVVALFIFCGRKRQVNKDSPYPNIIIGSPLMDSDALPTKCCGQCRPSAIPQQWQ